MTLRDRIILRLAGDRPYVLNMRVDVSTDHESMVSDTVGADAIVTPLHRDDKGMIAGCLFTGGDRWWANRDE